MPTTINLEPGQTNALGGTGALPQNTYRAVDSEDKKANRRWQLGFFAFYAAVAILLGGLAIADRPGVATIASARLGQATFTIDTGRRLK
jgi:hypothetical protein